MNFKSNKEKEDFGEMCNLSYGVEQKGRNLGLIEGKSLGMIEGKSLGITEGRNLGLIEGRIHTLAKLIMKIYKIDSINWLNSLSHEQLDRAENLILEQLSYEEFIKQVKS